MTPTLIILINILLSVILASALYTLKKRKRAVRQVFMPAPPAPRQLTASSYNGLPVQLTTTVNDDLVIASLFQPEPVESRESGKQCGRCSRLYDERSDFCYIDGTALSARLSSSAEFWVCTTCGHEGSEGCGCDNGPFRVQPDLVEITPMIPVARCSVCQDLGNLGSKCELDNIERTAVFEMNFRTFPPHGFGPRKKICLHCGLQFSLTAKYCSSDGHRLNLLN